MIGLFRPPRMRILVGCESSGKVRDQFIARGHDAVSCDLLPADNGGPHIQGDLLAVLRDGWDMMIAHPPCTFLTVAANKWMLPEYRDRFPNREQDRADAIAFALALWDAPIEKIALENPVSILSTTRLGEPAQTIQPYMFGDDASKRTCLWLKGLPRLQIPAEHLWAQPRKDIDPRNGNVVDRWSNQTARGDNKLPPSEDRWKVRSETFPGIAQAFAENWG